MENTKTDNPQSKEKVTFFVACFSIISGLAIVVMAHSTRSSGFVDFATYSFEALETSNVVLPPLTYALALGCIVVFVSSIGGVYVLSENQFAAKVYLFILFVLSITEIIGGLSSVYNIQNLDQQIQSSDGFTEDQAASELFDYSLSVFSKCCYDEGFYHPEEGVIVGECTTSPTQAEQSCYTNTKYFNYYTFATPKWTCDTLREGILNVDGVELQFGGIRLKVTQITNKATKIPIVGNHTDPTYGCGGGYTKGFQYLLYIWFQQTLEPLAFLILGVGSLQLLGVFISLASICLHSEGNANQETAAATYNRYMQQLNVSDKLDVDDKINGDVQTIQFVEPSI